MSTEAWLWVSNGLLLVALVIMIKAYEAASRRVAELERKLFSREAELAFRAELRR